MAIRNKLDHSRPFDRWRINDHKEITRVEELVFLAVKPTALKVSDIPKFRIHLKMILLDLLVAYKSDPKLYIAISRDKNRYGAGTRYGALHMSYRYTTTVLDNLTISGFIEQHKGFYDVAGRISRIKSKPKLKKLFDQHRLSLYMVQRPEDTKLIYLRDSDGNDTNYTDSGMTTCYRNSLRLINQLMAEHYIDLRMTDSLYREMLRDLLKRNDEEKKRWKPKKGKAHPYRVTSVDLSRNQLKRIFIDGSWELGGRFYRAWWQGIPSKYRKYIHINEHSTIELDYKQMHPTILYAICGEELVDDPYTLEGFPADARGDLKVVLNTMINAADPASAKKSLQYGMPAASLPNGYTSLDDVFAAFKTKHKLIADYFFSDYGKKLQYFDSLIAEDVMLVLHRHGVPCLPVHDSFIVAAKYEQLLYEVMCIVFEFYIGYQPQIKKDKTIYDVMKNKPILSTDDVVTSILEMKRDQETGKGIYSKYQQRKTEWYEATNTPEPMMISTKICGMDLPQE